MQVETQPHHIAGVLAEIRNTLENSDCEWEDIYSASYECEEDGTTTFYEGVYPERSRRESAEAGNPGICTYVVYDCDQSEEVVTNLDINTLDPALKLRQLVVEVIAATAIDSPDEKVQKLQAIARKNGISPESLLSGTAEIQRSQNRREFSEAANYVLNKNAELYRRLA